MFGQTIGVEGSHLQMSLLTNEDVTPTIHATNPRIGLLGNEGASEDPNDVS